MDRLIATNSVPLAGADTYPVSGTPQYATDGNPATNTPATIWPAYAWNMLQEEIRAVIVAGGITPDGSDWTQLLAAIQTLGRIKLTANLNLYVSPSGSDSNNGLSAATPFATLQHAYNVLFDNYDLAGNAVSIEVANGTYTAGLTCVGRCMGQSSAIAITGNTGSPSSCAIALSAAGSCFAVTQGAEISIAGFELSAPVGSSGLYAAGGLSLVAQLGGTIYYSSLIFGAAQYAHMAASNGGLIQPSANGQAYSIVGGAQYHAIAQSGGAEVSLAGCTVTLTGTPAFSGAFADADASGLIYAPSSGTSFSGSATGQRYSATNGGYISTGGGGASFIPGSSSGTSSTGYYT